MTTHLGPGDAATWGAVWHPNDPRQEDVASPYQDQLDSLSCMVEELRADLHDLEQAISRAQLSQAQMLTMSLIRTALIGLGTETGAH